MSVETEVDDVYDVLIVKRPAGHSADSPEAMPAGAEELRTMHRAIPPWAAAAFCRGFNEAECEQPLGVWAVMRKAKRSG